MSKKKKVSKKVVKKAKKDYFQQLEDMDKQLKKDFDKVDKGFV